MWTPTLAASPRRSPRRGSNSRLAAALRRSYLFGERSHDAHRTRICGAGRKHAHAGSLRARSDAIERVGFVTDRLHGDKVATFGRIDDQERTRRVGFDGGYNALLRGAQRRATVPNDEEVIYRSVAESLMRPK